MAMEWSNEKVIAFLEILQTEPCLWDPRLKSYKNRTSQNDAWRRIIELLPFKTTIEEVKKKKESLMDVGLVCVQHALSTEKEEIMGLLIGEVHNNGALVSIVCSVILRRLDKKPDRVEISEEQLVQATLRAEELAAEVNRPLRVVGWYHSHPHITVWPSHVDLATQSMYQRMDSSFVGIIFAVFLTDQTTKAPSIQITCFQSVNDGSSQSRREIEMEIINNNDSLLLNNFETFTQLPAILKEEEDEAYNNEAGPNETDDIINKQHNAAVRTIAIGHIVDKMSRPVLEGLVARNTLNTVRLKALKIQHQEMMSKLENMSCNV